MLKKVAALAILAAPMFAIAANDKPELALTEKEYNVNIVMIEKLNRVWVQFYEKKDFLDFSSLTPIRHIKGKYWVLPVVIYGVDDYDPKDSPDPRKDKQFSAYEQLYKVTKDKDATLKCFYRDQSESLMSCQVSISSYDIGRAVIKDGFSSFNKKSKLAPEMLNRLYDQSESLAKDQNLGIWEPYYNLAF